SASSSLSSNNSSSYHTAIASNDADFNLKELLEGQIDLKVRLRHLNEETNLNVERQMPLYDVLVIIANQFSLNPADYSIIASTDDNCNDDDGIKAQKMFTLKSNPVGLIGTDRISIVPKIRKNPNNKALPFTKTIRFTINLPQNQLMVKRIKPSTSFNVIKEMICKEKSIDPSRFLLVKPIKKAQSLVVIDLDKSPDDYGLNEVTVISERNYEQLAKQFTTDSRSSLYIDNVHSNRLHAQQQNDWSQSTPNISMMNRMSTTHSADTCSIASSRSRCFKKKPAPPPPIFPSNARNPSLFKSVQNLSVIHDDGEEIEQEQDRTMPSSNRSNETVVINQPKPQSSFISDMHKISLNRQNSGSDSSGYHERLSQTTTEIDTPTPTDSNSPQPPSSLSPVSNNSSDQYMNENENDHKSINDDNVNLVNDKTIQSSSSSSLSKMKLALNEPPKPASRSLKSNLSFNHPNSKKRRAPPPPSEGSKRSSPIPSTTQHSPSPQMISQNNNAIDSFGSSRRMESPCCTETSETELPNSLCCSEESNQELPSKSLILIDESITTSQSSASATNSIDHDDNKMKIIDDFKVDTPDGVSDDKIQKTLLNTTVIMADIHHQEPNMIENKKNGANDDGRNEIIADDQEVNVKMDEDAVVVKDADLNHDEETTKSMTISEIVFNDLQQQQQQQQQEIQKKRSRWLRLLNECGQDENEISYKMEQNGCSHFDNENDGQQCDECRYYIDNFERLRSKFQNEYHGKASTSGF
ncbi:hypothetical protein BLA29_001471, partial [Euroglyphus maynei]